MDTKATAPMVKSSWIWSGGRYADSDALAEMTANLNPMEVAQAALDAGIPREYYLGNIPSQWLMTGRNAEAYDRFLDSIGKLQAMKGNSMSVGRHPVRGDLKVPVVRSGNSRDSIGNLAEQEAALLTRIAEIDGLLTDKDTVQQWKDFEGAKDTRVYGIDYGGHFIHPNYDTENYVNPIELEARANAASLVAEGRLAKGDMASWVAKAVAGRRQELMAERGRLNAAEEALRNGPMRKFVQPVYKVMTEPDAGGDTLLRTRMQAAGVPLGKADGSYATVGAGLTDKLVDLLHDKNEAYNWILDHTPGMDWVARKTGLGEKGSDIAKKIVDTGVRIPASLVNNSLQSLDDMRQGARAQDVNNALEGRTYGNEGATAKVLNDARSNDGRMGTGSQGSNFMATSALPGIGNIALNTYFAGGLAKMLGVGGARVLGTQAAKTVAPTVAKTVAPTAAKATAPTVKSIAGKFLSHPSVGSFAKNMGIGMGLQAYDSFSDEYRHIGDTVETDMVAGVLPNNTKVPERRNVSGNGVTVANAGESMASRGADANRAEMLAAREALSNDKPYVPGAKGVSGVNKGGVEAFEKSLPEGGTSMLSRWWNNVKDNPWPWLAGAGAVLGGGMLLGKYVSNRRKARERKRQVRAPQARSYAVPDYRGVQPVQAPQLRGGWSGDDPFDFYTGDFYY